MADKYAKLHGIHCPCDLCAHVERQWGEVEQALAEARSRQRELRDKGAQRNAKPPQPADADAASGARTDDGGEDG